MDIFSWELRCAIRIIKFIANISVLGDRSRKMDNFLRVLQTFFLLDPYILSDHEFIFQRMQF